jgi:photosystem II stability/assembly factor-like uncharacterized protein
MKPFGRLAALCALAAVGCADGTSTLSLHVGATSMVSNVDHLSFAFTNVSRGVTSTPINVPWPDGAVPPERDLSFSFPSSVKGTVHVNAKALDAQGVVLVTGDSDITVSPSHTSSGVMTLGAHTGGVLPDAVLSTVTVDRASGVAANGADASTVTVTLKDSAGTPLAGLTVDLSATGSGGNFTMPTPTNDQGVTTSAFTSTVAETKTITASVNGLPLSQMPMVTFVSGGVATLKFVKQPADGVTLYPLTPFTVDIVDAQGNVITTASNPVTVALQTNPGGANLLGYATANAVNGEATFKVVGLDKAASGYTLTASASGLTAATSATFNVTPVPFRPVNTGVYGGPVSSLALAPAAGGAPMTLYAGTPVGVFKSTNNAGTWTSASFGLDAPALTLAVDPTAPSNVYAAPSAGSASTGTVTYFVKKSTNAGAAWLDLQSPDMTAQVGVLAIDPMNSAILYASNGIGLYKTTTGGASWVKTSFPYSCYALTIDPVTTSILYASAYDPTGGAYKGVYKSTDSGATWTAVNTGLASLGVSWVVATTTAVFADAGVSVYRSTNGGANWTDLGVGNGSTIAYAPSNPMIVYLGEVASGVAVSSNGGASFGSVVSVGGTVNAIVVDPANANNVFVGHSNGVAASTNGGTSWNQVSIGITALPINALAMVPSAAATVLAASGNTIYRTTDGGTTWSSRTVADTVWSLQFDPATTTKAYACSLGGNFYVSTDSGNTWGAAVATGGSPYCYNIDVHGSTIYVPTVGGVRKSTNGGASWAATGMTSPSYAVVSDATATTVVAGTNAGIFRSTNGGTNWSNITLDLANGLLADPMTATIIHAGLSCGTGNGGAMSSGGFRRSTDFGASFGNVTMGLCVNRMATNGNYVYAATRGGAPFAVTTDQGVNWGYGGNGIPSTVDGQAIAAAADNLTLYVGTSGGLYKSVTGGF